MGLTAKAKYRTIMFDLLVVNLRLVVSLQLIFPVIRTEGSEVKVLLRDLKC
jgi:hypothetical protein